MGRLKMNKELSRGYTSEPLAVGCLGFILFLLTLCNILHYTSSLIDLIAVGYISVYL
jgi:hypothetical protein